MPHGDVKSYHGHGGGGSGGGSFYDDEGRGNSKDVWNWFNYYYMDSGYSSNWLITLPDEDCYRLIKYSTQRYNLEDIAVIHSSNYDSRARRLVIQKSSDVIWDEFHAHLVEGYNRHKLEEEKKWKERNEKMNRAWEEEQAKRRAEAAIIERADQDEIEKSTENVAGMLRSDMETAFIRKDRISNEGDWIEEAVETYISGTGFGYEDEKSVGIKIQVTVSLDLSNSMYYNGVHQAAADAFRDISITLLKLENENPHDIFVKFFTFSEDEYYDSKPGKLVRKIPAINDGKFYGFGEYKPSKVKSWNSSWDKGPFRGEDTWIYPLFEKIETWEIEESDSGAVRLDLIITDAVLEHPSDIRQSDAIQERRDGNLQSVLLNFMPKEQWLGSTLPKRCYQIAVDKDNVSGILRHVLSEFIAVQL